MPEDAGEEAALAVVGIVGGTFDPLHAGHVALAAAGMAQLRLDEALFLPSGDPPHKSAQATARERLHMAELGAALVPGAKACDLEVARGGRTYTVDTLRQLRALRPQDSFVYLIGGDTLPELTSWRDFSLVCSLCSFAALPRPGGQEDPLSQAERLRPLGARVRILQGSGPGLSSTQIRANVRQGLSVAGDVPPAVERFLYIRGLYRDVPSREDMLRHLSGALTPKRLSHVLGVEAAAAALARAHGLPQDKAALAGLLHDLSKTKGADHVALCEAYGLAVDRWERQAPAMLHGRTSAAMARALFAVREEDVLLAIERHVTGEAGMTPLDMAVKVADLCEANRKYDGVGALRELAGRDLPQAFIAALLQALTFLGEKRIPIHPRTIECYNDALARFTPPTQDAKEGSP